MNFEALSVACTLIVLLNLLFIVLIIKIKRDSLFNPVLIMNLLWLLALVFIPFSSHQYYNFNPAFLSFVVVAIMSLNVSYIIGESLLPAKRGRTSVGSGEFVYKSEVWFRKTLGLYFLYAGLQLYSAYRVYQEFGGISSLLGEDGLLVRLALVEAGAGGGSNLILSMVSYILYFGHISLIAGGILFYYKRKAIYLAPLAISVIVSFAFLERNTFVNSLIMFLAPQGLVYLRKLGSVNIARLIRVSLIYSLSFIVMIAVIIVPLRIRYPDYGIGDVGENIASYVMGPFAGLNSYLADNNFYNQLLNNDEWDLGQNTFWSLISILNRLGMSIEQQPFHQSYVTVSYLGEITNVYTFMLFPLKDLGILGLIVASSALGFLCSYFKNRSLDGKYEYVVGYAVISTNIIMSFYSLQLRDVRQILLMLVPLILMQIRTTDKRQRASASVVRPAYDGLAKRE